MSVDAFGRLSKGSSSSVDLSGYLKTDGTRAMIGDLNLNNNEIVNLASPTNQTDAANKAYADKMLPFAGVV